VLDGGVASGTASPTVPLHALATATTNHALVVNRIDITTPLTAGTANPDHPTVTFQPARRSVKLEPCG
jgi:hypothetical protein